MSAGVGWPGSDGEPNTRVGWPLAYRRRKYDDDVDDSAEEITPVPEDAAPDDTSTLVNPDLSTPNAVGESTDGSGLDPVRSGSDGSPLWQTANDQPPTNDPSAPANPTVVAQSTSLFASIAPIGGPADLPADSPLDPAAGPSTGSRSGVPATDVPTGDQAHPMPADAGWMPTPSIGIASDHPSTESLFVASTPAVADEPADVSRETDLPQVGNSLPAESTHDELGSNSAASPSGDHELREWAVDSGQVSRGTPNSAGPVDPRESVESDRGLGSSFGGQLYRVGESAPVSTGAEPGPTHAVPVDTAAAAATELLEPAPARGTEGESVSDANGPEPYADPETDVAAEAEATPRPGLVPVSRETLHRDSAAAPDPNELASGVAGGSHANTLRHAADAETADNDTDPSPVADENDDVADQLHTGAADVAARDESMLSDGVAVSPPGAIPISREPLDPAAGAPALPYDHVQADESVGSVDPAVVSRATGGASSVATGRSEVLESEVPSPEPADPVELESVSRETQADEFPPSPLLAGAEWPVPATRRVIAIANQKGGVGKTTSTVNLAAALGAHGVKVLVIDLDPQGNASTALSVPHKAQEPSIYEVLIGDMALIDVAVAVEDMPNVWCAPATIDLAGAEIELVSVVARESRLKKAIDSIGDAVDYVFIDCPPSLGLLTLNAMMAATEILIPIQCEFYALEGLTQLLNNVELVKSQLNPELFVSTILLTMYDGRTKLADQVASEVRAHFGELVLDAVIPRSVRVSEAPGFGQTVVAFDPTSRGAMAYIAAAYDLTVRGQ
jgi:chromosome partitioning protein